MHDIDSTHDDGGRYRHVVAIYDRGTGRVAGVHEFIGEDEEFGPDGLAERRRIALEHASRYVDAASFDVLEVPPELERDPSVALAVDLDRMELVTHEAPGFDIATVLRRRRRPRPTSE